jgi:hypothetical protein
MQQHGDRMLRLMMAIALPLVLSGHLMCQTVERLPCDGGVLKEASENLGNMSGRLMAQFLLTFDDSCEINAEYSEWSNELLFNAILAQPKLFLSIMSRERRLRRIKIYAELESPIHDGINLDSTLGAIEAVKVFRVERDSVARRICIAIQKSHSH